MASNELIDLKNTSTSRIGSIRGMTMLIARFTSNDSEVRLDFQQVYGRCQPSLSHDCANYQGHRYRQKHHQIAIALIFIYDDLASGRSPIEIRHLSMEHLEHLDRVISSNRVLRVWANQTRRYLGVMSS